MTEVDRSRLRALMERERAAFAERHRRSRELFERARGSLLGGVPMTWMLEWAGGFPVFMAQASGARVTDVDGHTYVDLCLGDTGAMTGHSPPEAVTRLAERLAHGITTMLPTEDSIWVGEELTRRFGLSRWQFTLTATDANRFAIRIAREITGRPRILVFNHCYHGTVDETFITLGPGGKPHAREGNVGPPVDPTLTSRVVEFNDIGAYYDYLDTGEVHMVIESGTWNTADISFIPYGLFCGCNTEGEAILYKRFWINEDFEKQVLLTLNTTDAAEAEKAAVRAAQIWIDEYAGAGPIAYLPNLYGAANKVQGLVVHPSGLNQDWSAVFIAP